MVVKTKKTRRIPNIILDYIWDSNVETIIIELGERIREPELPDMIHNIKRFFEIA